MLDFFSFPVLLFVVELSLRVGFATVILLRRRFDSTTRLAWLVVVLLLPIIGAIAYLLVGEARLGAFRMRKHRHIIERVQTWAESGQISKPASMGEISAPYGQIASLAERVGGNYAVGGNGIKLFGDTNETIHRLIADINLAERHCHLLTYIYLTDQTGSRVAEALLRAEERGVECRLLVDSVGSDGFLGSPLCQRLRQGGVQVVGALPANPLRALFNRMDIRNHRKVAVIDGHIGYTGSQNIADAAFAPKERFAPWVDAMVRMEGPAVADLQLMFVEDWYLDTDEWLGDELRHVPASPESNVIMQVIGTGPNLFNEAMRQVHHAALHLARDEIVLTTPYFVPDEATISAMQTAAGRGVQTHLVVPARNDSWLVNAAAQSYYEALLDSGVHIHAYQPGLLHAKTITIDKQLAIVSSANLDKRSFYLNFECSVIVYDDDFSSELRFLQSSYMSEATTITPASWLQRSWPRRLWQNAAGMLSPLL